MYSLACNYIKRKYSKPGNVYLGVVQRLDRPVSGVVVFARTSKAAARLTAAFRERRVEKVYRGLSAGRPREDEGVLEQWLSKDRARNVCRVVDAEARGARLARTRWRVLGSIGEGARRRVLLELRPETGRPHQLRVAARSLGATLLGDLKYGALEPLPDRSIALHARELALDHPTTGERLRFRADEPSLALWRPFLHEKRGRRNQAPTPRFP